MGDALMLFQVECGDVRGAIKARGPGHAFRRIMRLGRIKKSQWGALARFRRCDVEFEPTKRKGVWFYQDPEALYKSE